MNYLFYPLLMLSSASLLMTLALHLILLFGGHPAVPWMSWGFMGSFLAAGCIVTLWSNPLVRHAKFREYLTLCRLTCPLWARRALVGLAGYTLCACLFHLFANEEMAWAATIGPAFPSVLVTLFFATTSVMFYSAIRLPLLLRPKLKRCPNGHPVSPAASFCPRCGAGV